ncbi:MAG: 30S ribosome-binding factor RbfA [Firmicutes bacterium]|nr:30S ribosome-binding factor RbfA [Bacillota bacterium]
MYRMERVNSEIMKALLQIIQNMNDKRISANIVTLTYVETSPDLKSAKIGVQCESGKDIVKLLNSSKGFIRHELANKLIMKNTPELNFVVDNTEANANKIEELLRKIKN